MGGILLPSIQGGSERRDPELGVHMPEFLRYKEEETQKSGEAYRRGSRYLRT